MIRGMQVPLAPGKGHPGTSRKEHIPRDTSILAQKIWDLQKWKVMDLLR